MEDTDSSVRAVVSAADVSVLSEEVAEGAVSSVELLSSAADVLSVLTVAEDDEAVLSAGDCDEFAGEEQPARQSAAIREAIVSLTFIVVFLSVTFCFFLFVLY